MVLFLKDPIKIRKVVKSTGKGHINDRIPAALQQLPGPFQAERIDVLRTGHSHMGLKKTHKMRFTETADFGKRGNCNGRFQVEINVVQHQFQLLALLPGRNGDRLLKAERQIR